MKKERNVGKGECMQTNTQGNRPDTCAMHLNSVQAVPACMHTVGIKAEGDAGDAYAGRDGMEINVCWLHVGKWISDSAGRWKCNKKVVYA
jgi:hypothetical protein